MSARTVFEVQLEESAGNDDARVRRVATIVETVAARGVAGGAERTWFEVRSEWRSAEVGGERRAGRFEDCLLLRYAGSYPAAPRGAPGQARLAGGRFESREWLARGVGPVRAEILRELEIDTGEGTVHTRRVREVRTLKSRGEAP